MKRAGIIVLLLTIPLGCMAYFLYGNALSPRPLFAFRWVWNAETGGWGWQTPAPISYADGTEVMFDDEYNILMVNYKSDPDSRWNFPGFNGIVSVHGGTARVPVWKDSAILYDGNGLAQIVFLDKVKARDLFEAIKVDETEIGRLFDPNTRPVRPGQIKRDRRECH